MNELVLVVDNIRSTYNVGSLFRTCDCMGVTELLLCGITPHAGIGAQEHRLPHQIQKIQKELHKTALGAEHTVPWQYYLNTIDAVNYLKNAGFNVIALEQDAASVPLQSYKCGPKTALIVGPEVTGVSKDILNMCHTIVEIPMKGTKESLNVAVAAGIALYELTE